MHQWKKSVAEHNVDAWLARLDFVEPGRLAVVSRPGAKSHSVEVYCELQTEADALVRQFGGTAREVLPVDWQPSPAASAGRPLSIASGRLLVTGREADLAVLRSTHPTAHVLCVPAAMAFGTGEHATTAMCLRFLVETSRRLNRESVGWNTLDLGTGSGILALAARHLGSQHVLGLDNDRHAVRTAKENAVFNELTRGVKFQQADLLRRWQPDASRPWTVVTANLFSNLLVALMPVMAGALAPGGTLILSGILAAQADEVAAAARGAKLEVISRRRKGKWVALLARHDLSTERR